MRKQAQISPPPFFFRLSPVGGSGWKPSTAKVSEVGADPRKQGGWVCGSRHKFPHRLFFCGCRLSAAAAGSHPTDDGKIHRCRRRSAGRVRGLQQPDGRVHRTRHVQVAHEPDGRVHRTRHVQVAHEPDGRVLQPFKTLFSWTRPQG